jgi:DNA-binding beta-propeller fold protein YncE
LAGNHKKGSKNGTVDATFFHPAGIAIDRNKNIYVADVGNQLIRKIDRNLNVSTIAGTGKRGAMDGNATAAAFWNPVAVAVNSANQILVVDNLNNLIRIIKE